MQIEQLIPSEREMYMHFDEYLSLLTIKMNYFIPTNTFREVLQNSFIYMDNLSIQAILFDLELFEVLHPADIKWLREFWFNELNDQKLQSIFMIKPKKIFGEVTLERITKNLVSKIPIRIFNNKKDFINYSEYNSR